MTFEEQITCLRRLDLYDYDECADTMEKLLAVYEAAGEYLYDTNKRQGLQDAYLAVQTQGDNNG